MILYINHYKYSMVIGFFSLYVIEELNISAEWFGNSILDLVGALPGLMLALGLLKII